MSEMLGNHYFQLRKYMLAEQIYESLSSQELSSLKIQKKMIICYTQTKKLQKAFNLFTQMIENDVETFIKSNLNGDDCPCNELIFRIESGEIKYENDLQTFTALGILWMFCNYKTSLNYFKMAKNESPANELIENTLALIEKYSNQINLKSN